jgi:hypothetical protein
MKITALSQQSLFDIAVQTTGGAETAFDLALANDISLTEDPLLKQELTPVASVNRGIVSYYAAYRLQPATWTTGIDEEEGINYWCIEYNFIVS